MVAARRDGGDVGTAELADRYDRSRRTDVTTRTLAVDLLNRSLLSDFVPMQGARGLSLFLMQRIGTAAIETGGAMSTEAENLDKPSRSSVAERMRLRRGLRHVGILLDVTQIEGLIRKGYLGQEYRDDRCALAFAIDALLSDALVNEK